MYYNQSGLKFMDYILIDFPISYFVRSCPRIPETVESEKQRYGFYAFMCLLFLLTFSEKLFSSMNHDLNKSCKVKYLRSFDIRKLFPDCCLS